MALITLSNLVPHNLSVLRRGHFFVRHREGEFFLSKMSRILRAVKPPLDFSRFDEIVSTENTRKVYEKQWQTFVNFSQITEEKPPTEDLLMSFIKYRREEGNLCGKSLQALVSGLSTVCLYFYNYKIDQVIF